MWPDGGVVQAAACRNAGGIVQFESKLIMAATAGVVLPASAQTLQIAPVVPGATVSASTTRLNLGDDTFGASRPARFDPRHRSLVERYRAIFDRASCTGYSTATKNEESALNAACQGFLMGAC
jgi:hypothetical protein